MHLPNCCEILGGKLLPLIRGTASINNLLGMQITHSNMSIQCMNLYLGITRKKKQPRQNILYPEEAFHLIAKTRQY